MSNVQIKLIAFSGLTACYTASFIRREWLVRQVGALLNAPDCRFVVPTDDLCASKVVDISVKYVGGEK
jgi:hypothetical protein